MAHDNSSASGPSAYETNMQKSENQVSTQSITYSSPLSIQVRYFHFLKIAILKYVVKYILYFLFIGNRDSLAT